MCRYFVDLSRLPRKSRGRSQGGHDHPLFPFARESEICSYNDGGNVGLHYNVETMNPFQDFSLILHKNRFHLNFPL